MLRLKSRATVLVIILFMFFVSFKIMEPELEAHPGGREVRDSSDYHDFVGPVTVTETSRDTEHDNPRFPSVAERVAYFRQRYVLDWHSNYSGDLWELAAGWVNDRTLYPDVVPELGPLLKKLTTAKIVRAGLGYRGTQLKMSFLLEGGQSMQRAAFKPKWYERDFIIDGKPYDGADRHNGEIASFHLNRLMGFRRSPIVVGRVVDMEREIRPVADPKLLETFFEKDGDKCFYGKCYYCRGPETGVCGTGDLLEGAVVLWLPRKWQFVTARSPWGRTYRAGVKAQWEKEDDFCDKVVHWPTYSTGPRLLDLIDATVFDHVIGNADAHHYDTFEGHNESMVILMDRAKSYGNPYVDEPSVLAPIYQCCMIRKSTWHRLKFLKDGVLSEVLREMLSHDSIAPVIAEPHFEAMDRRLKSVLEEIEKCILKYGPNHVLRVDKFSHINEDSGIS